MDVNAYGNGFVYDAILAEGKGIILQMFCTSDIGICFIPYRDPNATSANIYGWHVIDAVTNDVIKSKTLQVVYYCMEI